MLSGSIPNPHLPLVVTRVDDLPFSQAVNERGALETLRLDLYLPEDGSDALRPAVIWFHGGGFTYGNDRRQIYIPRFARAFAERGYAGVAPDYRLRADPHADFSTTLREAVTDARAALDWIRANSAAYRIDPRQIALAGGSAGGMIVLSLVHDASQPLDAAREGIFAILDLWGSPAGSYRLFPKVNPACPPTFIVHGTADELVDYHNSVNLAAELEQAGVPCTLLTLPGAPHTPLMHFNEIVTAVEPFLAQALKKTGQTQE